MRQTHDLKVFGPKAVDHPSCYQKCAACNDSFMPGDYTTLIPLGPGDSDEARLACRQSRPYNAVALEVHWACATGWEYVT